MLLFHHRVWSVLESPNSRSPPKRVRDIIVIKIRSTVASRVLVFVHGFTKLAAASIVSLRLIPARHSASSKATVAAMAGLGAMRNGALVMEGAQGGDEVKGMRRKGAAPNMLRPSALKRRFPP